MGEEISTPCIFNKRYFKMHSVHGSSVYYMIPSAQYKPQQQTAGTIPNLLETRGGHIWQIIGLNIMHQLTMQIYELNFCQKSKTSKTHDNKLQRTIQQSEATRVC